MAKKLPKQLAVLDEDLCTGCEACVAVCPVDCIDKINDPGHPRYALGICTIDLQICIGCKLCAQVCPWNVITMVPTDQVMAQEKFQELVTEEQLATAPR
ncbi:MAG TPA: 4Fe-4S dicluster domain-containing protein [Phycisphaerae bacterium]|nr:4Fe-4S dicluster domain-containing protein [Phycisphaerae bacterium]